MQIATGDCRTSALGETAIDILYHMQNPSNFGEVVGWLVLKIAMRFIGLVLLFTWF
jgi:hypothetical protein